MGGRAACSVWQLLSSLYSCTTTTAAWNRAFLPSARSLGREGGRGGPGLARLGNWGKRRRRRRRRERALTLRGNDLLLSFGGGGWGGGGGKGGGLVPCSSAAEAVGGQCAYTVHTKISPILIWADFFLSEMFGFSAQNDSPPGFFAAISPASFCKT